MSNRTRAALCFVVAVTLGVLVISRLNAQGPPAPGSAPAPERPGFRNDNAAWDVANDPPPLPAVIPDQKNAPVVIVGYRTAILRFRIISNEGQFDLTLEKNRSISFNSANNCRIVFDRGNRQIREYRLKGAVYRFLPSQSGWDLHHVVDLVKQPERAAVPEQPKA